METILDSIIWTCFCGVAVGGTLLIVAGIMNAINYITNNRLNDFITNLFTNGEEVEDFEDAE